MYGFIGWVVRLESKRDVVEIGIIHPGQAAERGGVVAVHDSSSGHNRNGILNEP